jgi:hypothetical protein
MKTFYVFAITTLLLTSSCKERQILTRIDGRWKVESFSFTRGATATSIKPSDSYLVFEKCNKSDNSTSRCRVQYHKDGQTFNFHYNTTYPEGLSSRLVIRLDSNPRKDTAFLNASQEVLGSYDVNFTSSRMTLNCRDCSLSQVGPTNYTAKTIQAFQ